MITKSLQIFPPRVLILNIGRSCNLIGLIKCNGNDFTQHLSQNPQSGQLPFPPSWVLLTPHEEVGQVFLRMETVERQPSC